MLDGILGRGFSSKCKSLIKGTGSRIELARRRAEAKQRFLKDDLAKLIANGLAVNAYGRTEEFMAGERILSCYGFIELSCEHIKKQLSSMQKQSGCPEECREAVASVMFAAARFSDLPELRDLRDLFLQRYGNGLECFVNQKFVEQLASKTPAMEKRIQLMHDIALEFQVQWDSAGFQLRMSCGEGKANKVEPSHSPGNRNLRSQNGSFSKPNGQNVLSEKKPEASKDTQVMTHGRDREAKRDDHSSGGRKEKVNEYKLIANKEGTHSVAGKNDIQLPKRDEFIVENNRTKKEKYGYEKQEGQNRKNRDIHNVTSTREPPDERDNENNNNVKSHYSYGRPPPYVKSKDKTTGGSELSVSESNRHPVGPSSHDKESEHPQNRAFPSKDESSVSKPKSVRRNHHKSPENIDGRSRPHPHRDEEEVVIDKLLMHYSRKSSDYDIEKLRKKAHTNQTPHEVSSGNVPPQPMRSHSFPHEQATPSVAPKVYTRANTFQPDHQARHVHPKLPDYEDLAAQFAALRGR
ncbi:hypothetical protein DM860_011653 [Cuscuta australis]|uniref:IST1-like protein n=1 Tax=Cuscuta australis TaxID=267555 RepID=A0A328DFW4_9ASTE|nr:hypothetical protein DM860_011653 [Cuscuta australis]